MDSGNLTASLYTLHSGALDLLKRPLLETETLSGLEQTLSVRPKMAAETNGGASQLSDAAAMRAHVRFLIQQTAAPDLAPPVHNDLSSASREIWFAEELSNRRSSMSIFVQNYAPWFLPQFEALFALPQFNQAEDQQIPSVNQAADYATELDWRIAEVIPTLPSDSPLAASATSLRSLLFEAAQRLKQLATDIATIASEAERHADAMHYGFLFVESRQLLSIGYDGAAHELHSACYDLLASEARLASFLQLLRTDEERLYALLRAHPDDASVRRLALSATLLLKGRCLLPVLSLRGFPRTTHYELCKPGIVFSKLVEQLTVIGIHSLSQSADSAATP